MSGMFFETQCTCALTAFAFACARDAVPWFRSLAFTFAFACFSGQ